jgi:hypothetical protein
MIKHILAPILLVVLLFPTYAGAETTLSCKSTNTENRAEIVIDRGSKTIVFWDMPNNSQNKFSIEFSIFYDGKIRGDLEGDIGAFSNHLDFFSTLTINEKNLNTTFAIHAREGRYSSQVELEEYKCIVGSQ